jgi:hypothetical protein
VAANNGVLIGGRKSLLVGSSGPQLGGDCSEKRPSTAAMLGRAAATAGARRNGAAQWLGDGPAQIEEQRSGGVELTRANGFLLLVEATREVEAEKSQGCTWGGKSLWVPVRNGRRYRSDRWRRAVGARRVVANADQVRCGHSAGGRLGPGPFPSELGNLVQLGWAR